MNDQTTNALDHLVADVDHEVTPPTRRSKRQHKTKRKKRDLQNQHIETGSRSGPITRNVVRMPEGVAGDRPVPLKPAAGSKPVPAKRNLASSAQLPRAYTKATVQKTIRFRPDLIAELDGYLASLEASGQPVPTIQQVQNDALDQWLEVNHRKRKG